MLGNIYTTTEKGWETYLSVDSDYPWDDGLPMIQWCLLQRSPRPQTKAFLMVR